MMVIRSLDARVDVPPSAVVRHSPNTMVIRNCRIIAGIMTAISQPFPSMIKGTKTNSVVPIVQIRAATPRDCAIAARAKPPISSFALMG